MGTPKLNRNRAKLNCNRATGTAEYKSGKVKPLGPAHVQAERTRNTHALRLRGTETEPQHKHAAEYHSLLSSGVEISDLVCMEPLPCGFAIEGQAMGIYYVIGYISDSPRALGLVNACKRNGIEVRALLLDRQGNVA